MRKLIDPANYDAWYYTKRGSWIAKHEFFLTQELLNIQPNASLLDVGCGTGYFSRCYSKLGVNVTGIDSDASMLVYAQRKSNGVEYLIGDARQLPFEDNSFDYCIAITSLCFIPDPEKALSEMLRVSRKTVLLGLLNQKSILFYQKHGKGTYQGARWDTYKSVEQWIYKLNVTPRNVLYKSVIFIPNGGFFAKLLEKLIPKIFPYGGYLAVKIDKPH